VIGFVLSVALVAALAATGYRAWSRRRLRRAFAALPGGSPETAIEVEAFTEIDEHVSRRECPCGGLLASHGERSEPTGQRVLRVARVECRRCEERGEIWFDASRAYH
jgi:hypothetical protein